MKKSCTNQSIKLQNLNFTYEQQSLVLLLGRQKQTIDKHGIGYEENNDIIILKPDILGKKL